VKQQVAKFATGKAADFLRQFGVKIETESNPIDIHWRPQPKLIVGENRRITAKPDVSIQFLRKSNNLFCFRAAGTKILRTPSFIPRLVELKTGLWPLILRCMRIMRKTS
jgi:hypothetical protein